MTDLLKKLRIVGLHPLVIEAVLLGSFLSFAFFPGSLRDIMRLGYVLFMIHLLAGEYRLRDLPLSHACLIGGVVSLLFLSLAPPHAQFHSRSLSYLWAVPGLVLLIHVHSRQSGDGFLLKLNSWRLAVIIVAVALNLLAQFVNGQSSGFYRNLHHLGFFSSLMIPLLVYFALGMKKWGRILAAGSAFGAFFLLWQSSSRVSWLAFFTSVLVTIFVFFRKKQVLVLLVVLLTASVLTAMISGQEEIILRIDDFLADWQTEERLYLWSDTVDMLMQGNLSQWLFGRGIGSFRYYFIHYDGLVAEHLKLFYTFPHNVILQSVFENGLIGSGIIAGLLIGFGAHLWRGTRKAVECRARRLYLLNFVGFWIVLLHSLLTHSLYSKYICYALSVIAGISLARLERDGYGLSFSTFLQHRIAPIMYAANGDSGRKSFKLLLYIISTLYFGLQAIRRESYRRGWRKSCRLPCKVVSAGNIVVGGTGKTPMTAYLVRALQRMGRRVVVVKRAYEGRGGGAPMVVSDGRQVLLDRLQAGDEAQMLARQLMPAPVMTGADRYRTGLAAVDRFRPDVIVLDDGFQHLRLQRDLDIVLLDGAAPLGNGHLLPRGILREPATELERADALVFTRATPESMPVGAHADLIPPGMPVYISNHKPYYFVRHSGDRSDLVLDRNPSPNYDFALLRNARVTAFSGIARNDDFQRVLVENGAELVSALAFNDHHRYTINELARIAESAMGRRADLLATTEKDYTRLPPDFDWPLDVMVIGVEIDFGAQEAAFRDFLRIRLEG